MTGCLLILTAAPDRATAERIADVLVGEGLAAAAHVRAVESRYRWKGAVVAGDEHAVDIFAAADAFGAVSARIAALHPYELPGILAVPVAAGTPAYLDWIRSAGRVPG